MTEKLMTIHKAVKVDTLWQIVDIIRASAPELDVYVQGDVDEFTAGPSVQLMGKQR